MSLPIYIYREKLSDQPKNINTFHAYTETAEHEVDIPLSLQNSCHRLDDLVCLGGRSAKALTVICPFRQLVSLRQRLCSSSLLGPQ